MPTIQGDEHEKRPEPAPVPAEADAPARASTTRNRFSNLRALGAVGLALLLYLVLIEAAVETFLSGAPVRWAVVGTIAGYTAATVVLWRRFGWPAKATASFFVLVFLLVLTTWLPDGATRGIALLGQPTSTVLSSFTALAILLAGVGLVRLRFLPTFAKGAIGFLALYGLAGFLFGIVSGTEYTDLFHGDSLWVRLPFWLQGAFIGALVLVPATVVFQIATGLRGSRGPAWRSRAIQIVGLSASVLISVAGLRAPESFGPTPIRNSIPKPAFRLGPVTFAQGESGGQPVGRAERFQEGVKMISAFFDFQGLKGEDSVKGVWYRGTDQLLERSVKMSDVYGTTPVPKKGHLWFSIKFEEGAPAGGYSLEISVNGIPAQAALVAVDPK